MSNSFNPHWVGDECCRDYKIGNIVLKSVPDAFVTRVTKFRGPYGFATGNVDEFTSKCKLEIPYNKAIQPTPKGAADSRRYVLDVVHGSSRK